MVVKLVILAIEIVEVVVEEVISNSSDSIINGSRSSSIKINTSSYNSKQLDKTLKINVVSVSMIKATTITNR